MPRDKQKRRGKQLAHLLLPLRLFTETERQTVGSAIKLHTQKLRSRRNSYLILTYIRENGRREFRKT